MKPKPGFSSRAALQGGPGPHGSAVDRARRPIVVGAGVHAKAVSVVQVGGVFVVVPHVPAPAPVAIRGGVRSLARMALHGLPPCELEPPEDILIPGRGIDLPVAEPPCCPAAVLELDPLCIETLVAPGVAARRVVVNAIDANAGARRGRMYEPEQSPSDQRSDQG